MWGLQLPDFSHIINSKIREKHSFWQIVVSILCHLRCCNQTEGPLPAPYTIKAIAQLARLPPG